MHVSHVPSGCEGIFVLKGPLKGRRHQSSVEARRLLQTVRSCAHLPRNGAVMIAQLAALSRVLSCTKVPGRICLVAIRLTGLVCATLHSAVMIAQLAALSRVLSCTEFPGRICLVAIRLTTEGASKGDYP